MKIDIRNRILHCVLQTYSFFPVLPNKWWLKKTTWHRFAVFAQTPNESTLFVEYAHTSFVPFRLDIITNAYFRFSSNLLLHFFEIFCINIERLFKVEIKNNVCIHFLWNNISLPLEACERKDVQQFHGI